MNSPLRVMIVEDEALLALQLEDDLAEAGYDVVGTAMSLREAVDLGRTQKPDIALVDIHLADGPTGIDVARTLGGEGATTVVFMTANVKRLPEDFAGAVGVIGKPYSLPGLRNVMTFLGKALAGGVDAPPPPSLRLAPALRETNGAIRISRAG